MSSKNYLHHAVFSILFLSFAGGTLKAQEKPWSKTFSAPSLSIFFDDRDFQIEHDYTESLLLDQDAQGNLILSFLDHTSEGVVCQIKKYSPKGKKIWSIESSLGYLIDQLVLPSGEIVVMSRTIVSVPVEHTQSHSQSLAYVVTLITLFQPNGEQKWQVKKQGNGLELQLAPNGKLCLTGYFVSENVGRNGFSASYLDLEGKSFSNFGFNEDYLIRSLRFKGKDELQLIGWSNKGLFFSQHKTSKFPFTQFDNVQPNQEIKLGLAHGDIKDVALDEQGNVLMAGSVREEGGSGYFVAELNAGGDLNWATPFPSEKGDAEDQAYYLVPKGTGETIVIHRPKNGPFAWSVLSADGKLMKTNNTTFQGGLCIIPIEGGGYFMAGRTKVKTDKGGVYDGEVELKYVPGN